MWIFLSILSIWILGIVIFYISDGWFHYNFKQENGVDETIGLWIVASITWPIWCIPALLRLVAIKAHDALLDKKTKIDNEKENKLKIRIAQEKETERVQKEIDKEIKEIEEGLEMKLPRNIHAANLKN